MSRSVKLGLLLSAAAIGVFPGVTVLGQTAGSSAHSLPESFRTGNTVSGAQSPIGLSVTDSNGQLIVTGATTNGPFGGLGLRVGDQITGVNGQPVATLGDLLSRLMAAGSTGQAAVASLDISRNGRPQTINVPNASLGKITQAISQSGIFGKLGSAGSTAGSSIATNTNALNTTTNTTTAANLIQESQGNAAGTNLSGTLNPISSTGTTNPINTTGTTNPISSVGTTNPVNSTGTTNPINSTGTTNPINSTGTTNPVSSVGTTNPINSTGTTNPINSTGTTNPISSVGTTNPINSTGTTNPINSTGTTNPINSVGTTNPINTTGTTNPINPTGTVNPLNAAGTALQTAANTNAATGGTAFTSANGSVNADLGVSLSVVNNGVMVTSLGGTGALANIGLQVGDQIVGINGQQVSSIAGALNGLLQAAQQGQNSLAQTATMTIARNGATQTHNLPHSALTGLLRAESRIAAVLRAAQSGTNTSAAAQQNTNASSANETGNTASQLNQQALQQRIELSREQQQGTNGVTPPPPTTGSAENERPFEAAEQQENLPTTVVTPSGPRIVMPGEREGQGRGAGGAPGVPGMQGKAAAKASGAAKGANKGGGAKAGGAARGGGTGAGGAGGAAAGGT